MGLILDWSKQQWLSTDAYKKSAVNFGRTSYFHHLQITNFVLLFSKYSAICFGTSSVKR